MTTPQPLHPREEIASLFARALSEGWALGQFNVENLEFAQAVAEASRAERAPLLVAASAKTLDYIELPLFTAMVRAAFASTGATAILHLDHGADPEMTRRCVDAGFDSVMIDGSSLPFEENVRVTREVVDYAHPRGVFVEGELGHVGGKEEDVESELDRHTSPEDAERFVRATGVDSLAIAVGTSHGAYKFKGEAELDYPRIAAIRDRLGLPLVLHGASGINPLDVARVNRFGGDVQGASGVPEEAAREAIRHGIVKINIATDLRIAFLGGLREALATHPDWIDPRRYLGEGRAAMVATVRAKLRMLGASGRA